MVKVLLAHAKDEEDKAEQLAKPIRDAGYEVAHEGTVLVGDSVIAEASKLLAEGVPVVLCGTVRAMGTKWARQVANAARRNSRLFVVQMEEEADVESITFDETIASYWQDPARSEQKLVVALNKYYPLDAKARQVLQENDLEARYKELTLKGCDIIDLANLPADDRHLVTRELELRRLYVALRMRVEAQSSKEASDDMLLALEARRQRKWGGNRDREEEGKSHVHLGERLKASRRVVVLGDPGAGKSTLLRWLTTALLLRLKNDPDWQELPDIATLPDVAWLPILVRCRDLPPKPANLDEILQHTLSKSELPERECTCLRALLRTKLSQGSALLLVDGLDEVSDPAARASFARQLDQIHRAYPEAPMVITSRIVGYREMGYRIRGEVEHLTVADLSTEDKDDFARRWCGLVERGERREAAAADLIHDIHSSDRIERLTGNPMLLTTMALIKRKIGKLPQRRVELYEKTVEVLLNWRSDVDAALDRREVLPQLEYLAYAMCYQGTQQLREDEVLELLSRVREEYPQIHPMRQHSPEEFLTLLERRTGLLIQSGHTRHNGQNVPVYEFRHLTIQEYLAGIAVVQGHFSNRDREKGVAQHVADLVGHIGPADSRRPRIHTGVADNWREALRLCVAACNDDDVDDVLRAILKPLPGETDTALVRTELAALCLADEPNVSETVAKEVLHSFASTDGFVASAEDDNDVGLEGQFKKAAALELSRSRWRDEFLACLLQEFFRREAVLRMESAALITFVVGKRLTDDSQFLELLRSLAEVLVSGDEKAAACAALTIMSPAFHPKSQAFDSKRLGIPEVIAGLMARLDGSMPLAHAALMALAWIDTERKNDWRPDPDQLEYLIAIAARPEWELMAKYFFGIIFARENSAHAVETLLPCLESHSKSLRSATVESLGKIGDVRAVDALLALLADKQGLNNVPTAEALGQNGDVRAVDALLAVLADKQKVDDVWKATVQALGKLGGEGTLVLRQKLLNDRDKEIRFAALDALSRNCQDNIERQLLSRDLDALPPSIDPQAPIGEARVKAAAEKLNQSCDEIRSHYQSLADQFDLKLEWQSAQKN